ncbi:hypothetical protein P43SY_003687 [Pythium insidiosum]|uniref:BZIP domain-containing protein n=1 Tax=Pythium insidiosum TaxID=114742 RepID=A0AAD5M092_PYTIN|nr:hypothetical protein P43SY_003687 [Pythium insidiosum]
MAPTQYADAHAASPVTVSASASASASTSASSDDDKKRRRREQNRLSAQRSYHKKQERLQALRSQVERLEATYQRHVSALGDELSVVRAASPSSGSSTVSSPASDAIAPPRAAALQHLLSQHAMLQHENDALRQQLNDHATFQFRMQSLLSRDGLDPSDASDHSDGSAGGSAHGGGGNGAGGAASSRRRVHLQRPLTLDECYAIGLAANRKVQSHAFPTACVSTGGMVCGWSDRRAHDDGRFKFSLRKVFAHHRPQDVALKSWHMLLHPEHFTALYSATLNMHIEIVQRLDDNNVVMYQEYEIPERDPETGRETGYLVVVHTLFLTALFQIPDGYVVVFKALEPDRLAEQDHIVALDDDGPHGKNRRRRKMWLHKLSWCMWKDVDDGNATESSYTLTVPLMGASSLYWLLEMFLMVMRYESAVFGPVVVLPSSADADDDKGERQLQVVPRRSSSSASSSRRRQSQAADDEMTLDAAMAACKVEPLASYDASGRFYVDPSEPLPPQGTAEDVGDLLTELFPC